uniref:Troponin i n=2 Tax=Caenorhabditis tropicalis TaxID=1561998 RepID=A0A1I7TR52_9PELO
MTTEHVSISYFLLFTYLFIYGLMASVRRTRAKAMMTRIEIQFLPIVSSFIMMHIHRNDLLTIESTSASKPSLLSSFWSINVQVQMSEEAGEDAQRKAAEREAKKAEVRKRLEEAGNKKKSKKGFLTPERKKKLRKLLMVKAAEDLKRQQLLKEQERQKALADRTIPLPNVDFIDDKGQLEKIYNDLWARLTQLEEEKYDINYVVSQTEAEINSLTIEVNDLRGKFVKPSLKKVSKYDNKFKKSGETKAGAKEDFRANLKIVKKDVMESITNVKKKDDKPDWSKKNKEAKTEEAAPAAAAPEPEPAAEEPEAADPEAEEEEGEEEEEE